MIRRYTDKAPITAYYSGVRCPSCTMKNWLIGRLFAECGRCGYALFLHPGALDK